MDWENVRISAQHNSVQFEGNPLSRFIFTGSLTLGNTMHHSGGENERAEFEYGSGTMHSDSVWKHEVQHTYQGQQLGPLYLPSNILGMAVDIAVHGPSSWAHGPANWNERGPGAWPPRPWK